MDKHLLSPLILIGIDGGTWDMINPLINQGKLPNIAKLKTNGSYGVLQSIQPMVSPRLWTTIATGKRPEKHGITGFFSTADDIKSATIWDIVERNGGDVGLMNMMPTWPPRVINGFVVPGWMARDAKTYPENLGFIKELEINIKNEEKIQLTNYLKLGISAIRHGITLGTLLYSLSMYLVGRFIFTKDLDINYRKRLIKLRLQRDLFYWLLKNGQPSFVGILFDIIDSVSHKYWKYMEPEKFSDVSKEDINRYQNVIHRCYIEVDNAIGKILKRISDDTTVIIASDHGFSANLSEDSDESTKVLVKITQLIDRLSLSEEVDGFSLGQWFTISTRATNNRAQKTIDAAFNKASVLDVAPTMLHLEGLPVAEDMDGEILTDAVIPQFLDKQPVKYVSTYDSVIPRNTCNLSSEEDLLKKQLRDLGYIE